MPIWTLIGLLKGTATTPWPLQDGDNGQAGVLGMPKYDAEKCLPNCTRCADACLPNAISIEADNSIQVDYGKCIQCQLCTEVCPTGAFSTSDEWAISVTKRQDLVSNNLKDIVAKQSEAKPTFKRSLHIRHVDAGSCNGCESELNALNNPFYDLERLGIFFTDSPRKADLLLVTGPVTYNMKDVLLETHAAMPKPCWVMAVGVCAVSGGCNGGGYASYRGLDGILPVDVYLPGCPPNPAALITALMMFLNRTPQKILGAEIVNNAI